MEHNSSKILALPTNVVGRIDIGRLLREVDALDSFIEASAIREPGTQPPMPKTSRLLDEILLQNKLNALVNVDRLRLKEFLEAVKAEAPVLHMSFGADPSPLFAQKLIKWLREEIHPLVLLQVGLQPTIGAGCVVRSTNKQFDFSLRQRLRKQRDILIRKINEINRVAPPVTPATVPTPVAIQSEPSA